MASTKGLIAILVVLAVACTSVYANVLIPSDGATKDVRYVATPPEPLTYNPRDIPIEEPCYAAEIYGQLLSNWDCGAAIKLDSEWETRLTKGFAEKTLKDNEAIINKFKAFAKKKFNEESNKFAAEALIWTIRSPISTVLSMVPIVGFVANKLLDVIFMAPFIIDDIASSKTASAEEQAMKEFFGDMNGYDQALATFNELRSKPGFAKKAKFLVTLVFENLAKPVTDLLAPIKKFIKKKWMSATTEMVEVANGYVDGALTKLDQAGFVTDIIQKVQVSKLGQEAFEASDFGKFKASFDAAAPATMILGVTKDLVEFTLKANEIYKKDDKRQDKINELAEKLKKGVVVPSFAFGTYRKKCEKLGGELATLKTELTPLKDALSKSVQNPGRNGKDYQKASSDIKPVLTKISTAIKNADYATTPLPSVTIDKNYLREFCIPTPGF